MDQRQWAQHELAELKAEHKQLGSRIQALELLLRDTDRHGKEPTVPPLNTARSEGRASLEREREHPAERSSLDRSRSREYGAERVYNNPPLGANGNPGLGGLSGSTAALAMAAEHTHHNLQGQPQIQHNQIGSSSPQDQRDQRDARDQRDPRDSPRDSPRELQSPQVTQSPITSSVGSSNTHGTATSTSSASNPSTPPLPVAPLSAAPPTPASLCGDARIIGRISARVFIGLLPEVSPAMRSQREDPIVVLQVGDGSIEWHIAKSHAQMRQLDNEIRANTNVAIPQLPPKGQWTSCSPVKIDVRIDMLNAYLHHLQALCSNLYPKGQNAYSQFLSSDIVHLSETRCSFLVSRSRFSGWKARFVILNGNRLDILEKPTGSVSQSINLSRATISPIADNITSSEDEYRHGFTVVEPRDTSSKTTTHYFSCDTAENRRLWLEVLASKDAPSINSRQVLPFKPEQPAVMVSSNSIPSPVPPSPRSFSSRRKSAALTVDLKAAQYEQQQHRESGLVHSASTHSGVSIGAPMAMSPPMGPPTGMGPPSLGTPIGQPRNSSAPSAVAITHRNSGPTSALAQRRVMSPTFQQPPMSGKTNVFRVTLGTALGYSSVALGDAVVPTIVGRCIEFLNYRQAYLEEGLFRISGTQSQVDALEVRFERDDVDVDDLIHNRYDVHVIASLLKRYFRLLPEPLIAEVDDSLWRELLQQPVDLRNAHLRDIVQNLPSTSYDVLSVMTQFLGEVHRNSAINKMTPQNLGIVFSPTLGIPGAVIIGLIEHQDVIFG